ncbi:MAG: sugar ABC transporter permease [Anaerolineae bacterium]|nr:sugar ABC transporter permease [Anaerolineae bacterium]
MNAIRTTLRYPRNLVEAALRLDISDRALAYVMILPAAILILLFAIYPAIQGLLVSLNRVEPATFEMHFVALDNYQNLLGQSLFWDSLGRTIILVGVGNVIQLALGMGISLLVHQNLVGRNIVRGIVLFPYLVPAIVIAITWRYMLDPTLGILNKELVNLGLISRPYPFMTRPDSAIGVVIFAGIWKYTPFFVIMLLARLQVIPVEIGEAARLDGASSWKVFRHITLPWLMPVIIIALLLRTIWTFNEFEMVYLFAFGGPLFSTTTLPVLVNHYAKEGQAIGMAAATATIMVIILLILSWIYFVLYDRAENALY